MRELCWLVQQLQARFHLPASRVFLHSDIAQTNSPGQLFPVANFRQQLLQIPEAR
jgi:N-acetyl-anhydromuramyl-L-alanine amidase AmpD